MSRPTPPGETPTRHRSRGAVVAALLIVAAIAVTLVLRPDPDERSAAPSSGPSSGPSAQPSPSSPAPSPSVDPPQGEERAPLTWPPPELDDPETIELSADNRSVELEPDRDYLLELPDSPLAVRGGVTVEGGRNVVLIGGEIRIDEPGDSGDVRGLYLVGQTGTIHVEGVRITGDALGEGINLDQREGAVVQLQNIRIDTVAGERDGHHADLLQSWAGPRVLRVDGFSGTTTYQGFFLLPRQFGDQEPELVDLRRVDIVGEEGSGYLLWRDDRRWPIELSDVWVTPADGEDEADRVLWAEGPAAGDWEDVRLGVPPGGPFVPEGAAGVGYVSPGYLEGAAT